MQKNSFFYGEVLVADEGWKYDSDHEISDRIMGYQPGEDLGWGIGNRDIMAEIRMIPRDEALQHIFPFDRKTIMISNSIGTTMPVLTMGHCHFQITNPDIW